MGKCKLEDVSQQGGHKYAGVESRGKRTENEKHTRDVQKWGALHLKMKEEQRERARERQEKVYKSFTVPSLATDQSMPSVK